MLLPLPQFKKYLNLSLSGVLLFSAGLSHAQVKEVQTLLPIAIEKTTVEHPPHLDLDLTGAEYRALMEATEAKSATEATQPSLLTFQAQNFDDIFATGKRNLDWLQVINKHRSTPLSLSTPETQIGYPITNPRIYNPTIIRNEYNKLQQEMPAELKKVIFGNGELPTQLTVPDADYIFWGLKVDRSYQIAARWRSMEPYMNYLKNNSVNDIRDYYFLTTTPGFPQRLKEWSSFTPQEQAAVRIWLQQVCRNDLQNPQSCQNLTDQAIRANNSFDFFNQHKAASQQILSKMMYIPANVKFSRTQWKNNFQQFHVPFVDPQSKDMQAYLTYNIETEWKFLPFSLHIDFVPRNQFGVEVVWEPGITPHVPSLGANTIYMDSNAPISEYDVQWTIRHEFGHVLGFPDCYIELYDNDIQAIVGYQIDITDLMCSRRGHLKERHVAELKRVYN